MTKKNRNTVTLQELGADLQNKKVSSVELTRQYLDAIEKDTLNAFITVNDNALSEAKLADERIAQGEATMVTGIPIAVKDVLVTKGLRTTAASKMLSDYIPPYTATAVQRLQDAGMVILGKTNCDEFAMGASNENSAYGPVKNPHDPSRVPGGSSGGSAAAVAAGLAPIALGTDTGGSVRQPASFCGLVGFKPTYGRISRNGLIAMASSFDQVGTLSHSAHDAAILLKLMAGHDPYDATSSREAPDDYVVDIDKPLRRITIGIPKEYNELEVGIAEELLKRARKQLSAFPQIEVVDIRLPHSQYALAAYYVSVSSEISANLARYDGLRYGLHDQVRGALDALYRRNRSEGLGAEPRRRIMLGTYSLSAGYYDQYYTQAAKVRRLIRQDFDEAFKKVDVIIGPTTPTPPFTLGEKIHDPLLMYLSDLYTVAANLAGIPAVSYPAGKIDTLPVGLQLMGPPWSEKILLEIVHHLMSA